MKRFECNVCGNQIYFENTHCGHCGYVLGFDPHEMQLHPLRQEGAEDTLSLVADNQQRYRFCANNGHVACNWLVSARETDTNYCAACELNRTIPDTHIARNVALWRRMEVAKRRLIYSILRARLPIRRLRESGDGGVAFDFLAGQDLLPQDGPPVMTGHDNGIITINLAEADDALRERNRQDMEEPYRTLLGHFRHEIGHYYWDQLVRSRSDETPFRQLFGDERQDYGAALEKYYAQGPPADWNEHYVSQYASAHPWEDFAETWAHYLHIVDTLETAQAIGLQLHSATLTAGESLTVVSSDPYASAEFGMLATLWLPLTRAINSLNRSMGQPDLYPFVLAEPMLKKLGYVHNLVRSNQISTAQG